MNAPMHWFLRHFPTQTQGICFGQLDVPGPFTSEDLKRLCAQIDPAIRALFCSPAQRCHSLAVALADQLGLPLQVHEELREINFGQWEGKSWSDIPRSSIDQWATEIWTFKAPGGESPREVCKRVQDFRTQILDPLDHSCLIVSHAGVRRVWNLDPLSTDAPHELLLKPIPHGELIPCKD